MMTETGNPKHSEKNLQQWLFLAIRRTNFLSKYICTQLSNCNRNKSFNTDNTQAHH